MTVKRITTPFKVAAVEFNAEFMELDRNIDGAVKIATEAAKLQLPGSSGLYFSVR